MTRSPCHRATVRQLPVSDRADGGFSPILHTFTAEPMARPENPCISMPRYTNPSRGGVGKSPAQLKAARERAIQRYERTRSYADLFKLREATEACLRGGA